jgi:hypothetical protein
MRTGRKKKPFIFFEISASLFQIFFPPFFSLAGRFRHVAEVAIILRKDGRLAKFGTNKIYASKTFSKHPSYFCLQMLQPK